MYFEATENKKPSCIPTKQKSLAEIPKTMYTVFVEEVCFMETIKNVLVGQSGGPTAVINASLAGVYETARASMYMVCAMEYRDCSRSRSLI